MKLTGQVFEVKIGVVTKISTNHTIKIKCANQCKYQTWFDIAEDKSGTMIDHIRYIDNSQVYITDDTVILEGNSLYDLLSYYRIPLGHSKS